MLICHTVCDVNPIRHVVNYSGGICSWCAAKRVIERHGLEHTKLIFADTRIEDDDLYRFLLETVSAFAGRPRKYHCFTLPPLTDMEARKRDLERMQRDTMVSFPFMVWLADGRTPWELMRDEGVIARSGLDLCSRALKRELLNGWTDKNAPDAQRYFGIDWTESHRLDGLRARLGPNCHAPMCEPPYLNKFQMIAELEAAGIKPPRLYGAGFPHNNCGGFCVKAGQAHFAHLLRTMPERYAYHEAQEEAMREQVGNHSMLKSVTNGQKSVLTLKQLRERIEKQHEFDAFDWGGCGCAVE